MDVVSLLDEIFSLRKGERTYYTYGFQKDYQKNEVKSFGYVPFIKEVEIKKDFISLVNKNNRTGLKRESTKYIVIHDTASASPSSNAYAHQKWLESMASDPTSTTTVSWHYTIDEETVFNHIPNDEVAYHAGDGTSVKLDFIDTDISYKDGEDVLFSIIDNKISLNGIKTSIEINEGIKLPTLGINYIRGSNGNYFISNTYLNKTYNTISNRGGNLNSIGIETCVNYGSNYLKVMQNTAYVCSLLLKEYNLDINSIKQHNSFSGKDCPMTMRKNDLWDEFIRLVKLNCLYLDLNKKIEFIPVSNIDEYGSVTGCGVIKYIAVCDGKEYVYSYENEKN